MILGEKTAKSESGKTLLWLVDLKYQRQILLKEIVYRQAGTTQIRMHDAHAYLQFYV